MSRLHNYSEINRDTCKGCRDLYNLHGSTDAQIDEPHFEEPIIQRGKKRLGENEESSMYDIPSFAPKKPKVNNSIFNKMPTTETCPECKTIDFNRQDNDYHEYDERNADTCKNCKDIYDIHGSTDAQIEDYHKKDSISGGSRRKRRRRRNTKRKKSKSRRRQNSRTKRRNKYKK